MWIATACLLVSFGPADLPANSDASVPASPSPETGASIAGNAASATSVNFRVRSLTSELDARDVARHCESWRQHLKGTWCSHEKLADWSIACEIVVHPTRASYLGAVGRGGERTSGSSYIGFDAAKRVNSRRIDLLAEAGRGLSALPHEMTHLVLFDLLGRQPPRWADEGLAILADAASKQRLHQDDLQRAFAEQAEFRVADLVNLDGYPHPARIPAFYGQSASVTAFLARRDRPEKVVAFLKRCFERGYDQSLRDVYGIDGLTELERLWQADRAGAISFHGMRLSLNETALENADLLP